MPGFFVRAEIEAVNDGVIVLKVGKKILQIPSKVHPSLFDPEIKRDLKTNVIRDAGLLNKEEALTLEAGVICDADVFNFEEALLVVRDPRKFFYEEADSVIWTAYFSGGKIFVNEEMLN